MSFMSTNAAGDLRQIDFLVRMGTTPQAMSQHSLGALHATLGSIAQRPLAARRPRAEPRSHGVQVIQARGYISQDPNILTAFDLGVAIEDLQRQLRLGLIDDSVDAIVLDVNSAGGSPHGCTEFASELRDATRTKSTVAVVNSVAEGAGYWLAASCGSVYCTPGGQVGGIGMVAQHADESGALEQAGIRMTLIAAGKNKLEGNPFEPLSASGRAAMQEQCDTYADMMIGDIAAGRRVSTQTVRSRFGQGRAMNAMDAKAAGLVDGIKTFAQVVTELKRGSLFGTSGGSALAASVVISRAMRGVS